MSEVTLNPLECALDEAQALRGQVDALQAENAALREEFNKMDVWHSKELTAAMADNAKLRELLQRALTSHDKICTNRGTCLGCLFFKAKPFAPVCPIVSVTRDARELGVEVDG